MKSTQRVPACLRPYSCFRNSRMRLAVPTIPPVGSRDTLRPRLWKYALVTSAVNVRHDILRLKQSMARPVFGVELGTRHALFRHP